MAVSKDSTPKTLSLLPENTFSIPQIPTKKQIGWVWMEAGVTDNAKFCDSSTQIGTGDFFLLQQGFRLKNASNFSDATLRHYDLLVLLHVFHCLRPYF